MLPISFEDIPRMKRCRRCDGVKELKEFSANAKATDGKCSWCKDCQRNYMRTWKGNVTRRRNSTKRSAVLHPEKRRARNEVKRAVAKGTLPPVKDCTCTDCSNTAQAYDHHLGYDQPLAVQPVCHECHGRRSRGRGEHKPAPGTLLITV